MSLSYSLHRTFENGAEVAFNVLCKTPAGDAIDTTGATFSCKVYDAFTRAEIFEATLSDGITLIDAPTADIQIKLTTAQKAALTAGRDYIYDVRSTTSADGERVQVDGDLMLKL